MSSGVVKNITGAFEPHMGVFVDAQDKYDVSIDIPVYLLIVFILELLRICLLLIGRVKLPHLELLWIHRRLEHL